MKILIITPSYKPAFVYGGPIFSVSYLVENLQLNKQDVLVLTTAANGKKELNVTTNNRNIVDGVEVIYFNRQTKDHTHFSYGLLKFLWNNGAYFDVIHIQSWWNLVAVFAAIICKIRKWKYVISPRGMLSEYTYNQSIIKKIIHYIIGNILLKSSTIHTTSLDEKFSVEKLNKKYNIKVIPNHINLNVEQKIRKTNQVFQFLFISRVHQKKRLELLFNTLSSLSIDFHLNIAGDGDEEYIDALKILSNNLGIEKKITWLGPVYGEDKNQLYASSDLLILPSFNENFANVVLESLIQGTPVLLSKQVALSEFVLQNNLGWIFDGSEEDFIKKLHLAINQKGNLGLINTKSREIVLKEFDNSMITHKYVDMYKQTALI